MKKQPEFTAWEKDILAHIKKNAKKHNYFIATIPSVSRSGMSRTMKFAIIYKGEFTNITYLMAKVLGKNLNRHDAISVSGCGMDMVFHTLDCIHAALGFKQAWKNAAVQHYKLF